MTIKVEVFSSPGCTKCGHAINILQKIAAEAGQEKIEWREVNIMEELDYAVDLGVLSTPAIAIDGDLVFTGLPGTARLRKALEQRLSG